VIKQKNNTGAIVWINDAMEEYVPPENNVLGVSVMGDGLALTIATYEENGLSCTYTTVGDVIVDLRTFLKALLAATDNDTAMWMAQLPTWFTPPALPVTPGEVATEVTVSELNDDKGAA
jgi:hypothetical protein